MSGISQAQHEILEVENRQRAATHKDHLRLKQDQEDYADTTELLKNPSFKRYFLRRLREKSEALVKKLTAGECKDYMEYHSICKQIALLESLHSMTETDRLNAAKSLKTSS